jgi:hypothetical protein
LALRELHGQPGQWAIGGIHAGLCVVQADALARAQIVERLTDMAASLGLDRQAVLSGIDVVRAAGGPARRRLEESATRTTALRRKVAAVENAAAEAARERLAWSEERDRLADAFDDYEVLIQRLVEVGSRYEAAEEGMEKAEARVRAAREQLDAILGQRRAANEAIREADKRLRSFENGRQGEVALRREIEDATRVRNEAERAYDRAFVAFEDVRGHLDGDAVERERLIEHRQKLRRSLEQMGELGDVAVRNALDAWRLAAEHSGPDVEAMALAERLVAAEDNFAQIAAREPFPPTKADLLAAEERFDAAILTFQQAEEAIQSGHLTPALRAEIEEAHQEVMAAEEVSEQRFASKDSKRRLAEARDREYALLARAGLETYLDLMVAGNTRDPVKERALVETKNRLNQTRQELEEMQRAARPSPARMAAEQQVRGLRAKANELLGRAVGEDVISELLNHRPVPRTVDLELRNALYAAGVDILGSPTQVAEQWLVVIEPERDKRAGLRQELVLMDKHLVAIEARMASPDPQVLARRADAAAAEYELDRATQHREVARRRVTELERDLFQRASQEEVGMGRAQAEELRAQIAELQATIDQNESKHRGVLVRATETLGRQEEAVIDTKEALTRVQVELQGLLNRHDYTLERPQELGWMVQKFGDELRDALQEAETEAAEAETTEISAGRSLRDAERQLADALAEAPLPSSDDVEDMADGLRIVAVERRDSEIDFPIVFDDAFVAFDRSSRMHLLETLADLVNMSQMIYLTEDAEILAWAQTLPSRVAGATRVALVTDPNDPCPPADPVAYVTS